MHYFKLFLQFFILKHKDIPRNAFLEYKIEN